jgi:hypothetical protein
MTPTEPQGGTEEAELFTARRGVGPLLQRDYWAVLRHPKLTPREIGTLLAWRFAELAPPDWVGFRRHDGAQTALELGDLVDVHIRGVGDCEVKVIHKNPQSLTLATVRGHPEAGRITFGAYRNRDGDVIFHIRSHARASSRKNLFGYLGPGDPMQTSTWTDFVDRMAATVAEGVQGFIRADTRRISDEPDETVAHEPTYLAEGD